MTEQIQPQDNVTEAEAAGPPAGELLRAARERQGMSLAEAARQLRLSPRQVEALESDDYARLPGMTFVRGFIRNYAKLLQLDPEPVLRSIRGSQREPEAQSITIPAGRIEFSSGRAMLRPFFSGGGRPWLRYTAIGLVVLGAVSWVVYEALREAPSKAVAVKSMGEMTLPLPLPQPQAGGPAPVPGPAPAATTEPAAEPAAAQPPAGPGKAAPPVVQEGGTIKLVFSGESWVEITDKSGRKIFSQLNPAGSERVVHGVPPFSLVVGNAPEVKLFYNDKPLDLAQHTAKQGTVARLTLE